MTAPEQTPGEHSDITTETLVELIKEPDFADDIVRLKTALDWQNGFDPAADSAVTGDGQEINEEIIIDELEDGLRSLSNRLSARGIQVDREIIIAAVRLHQTE